MPAEANPGVPTRGVQADDDLTSRSIAPSTQTLTWRRAQCSANSCVELAVLPDGGVAIRGSKPGEAGPILHFSADEWSSFVTGVKAGEFG